MSVYLIFFNCDSNYILKITWRGRLFYTSLPAQAKAKAKKRASQVLTGVFRGVFSTTMSCYTSPIPRGLQLH